MPSLIGKGAVNEQVLHGFRLLVSKQTPGVMFVVAGVPGAPPSSSGLPVLLRQPVEEFHLG
jgi:hypothetical protein